MTASPERIVARLALIQLVALAVAFALVGLFAPRVLVLDAAEARAVVAIVLVLGVFTGAFSTAVTLLLARPIEAALGVLAVERSRFAPADVTRLYALPARLAWSSVGFAAGSAVMTMAPWLRPRPLDVETSVGVVLLIITFLFAAALPSYVMMRVSVGRVLELVPPHVTERAIDALGARAKGVVRGRLGLAVAAPVALVALASSLLVEAHARAEEHAARAKNGADVVRAMLAPLGGVAPEALAEADRRVVFAAEERGYAVRIERPYTGDYAERRDAAGGRVVVPLEEGAAVVRFGSGGFSRMVLVYALLAVGAIALAAALGARLGGAYAEDIVLATRVVGEAGVAEVMRGTLLLEGGRFAKIRQLLRAVDALGGVFREFASAHQRSTQASEATERMRALLLASMSHDLKSPLNAVLGFAAIVARGDLTGAQRESVAIIEQRGRELLALVDTILDSARAEAGELEMVLTSTSIADVVMASVLDVREALGETDVEVSAELQPDLRPFVIDGTRLAQALSAVISTAARFAGKGIVPVTASLAGERLRIEVESSAAGLPESERARLLSAFEGARMARRQGSLGLGVQLARSILEMHGGSLEVGPSPGGGVVFRLWLPARA